MLRLPWSRDESPDREDRYWDAFVNGERPAADIDPALAGAIAKVHALDIARGPDPAFVAQLEHDLVRMQHVSGSSISTSTQVNQLVRVAPNRRRIFLPALTVSKERRQWVVAQFATAALLIVTLLGMYLVFINHSHPAIAPPATPTATPLTDVPFDRGNLARTGEMPGAGPTTKPPLWWSFVDENDGVFSSAVVVDGVVYVGNRGRLLALDARTGTKRWEFPIQVAPLLPAPAVSNGLVYVGSTNGDLYAIDATSGTQRWVYSTDGLVYSSTRGWTHSTGRSILSSPLIADGVVYVTAEESLTSYTDAYLIALNAATGEELWTFDIGSVAAASPAYDDGVILVSGSYWVDGRRALFAVDAVTGSQRWMFQTGGVIDTTPAIANGLVYIADDHALYALDAASGTERWQFGTGGDASSTRNLVAVANGIVYAVDDVAGTLYALDAERGAELWEATTVPGTLRAPVVAGSVLYLGTQEGMLLALDAQDGHELWREDTGSHILSSPTVSHDVVFFGDEGTFYALGEATETTHAGE
jgi:eukaryotic-like serine/threonine-protein kinase